MKKFGREFAEEMKKNSGKPFMGAVFYSLILNGKVKYIIRCTDDPDPVWQGCHLHFPWGVSLMVDVAFNRDDIDNIVAMADLAREKLQQFEPAGQAYKDQQQKLISK